jgi:hypothetical protein
MLWRVLELVTPRMQRKKGQFTSKSAEGGEDSEGGEAREAAACSQCGAARSSTPMMRRGPLGPRTLCNACGNLLCPLSCCLSCLSSIFPLTADAASSLVVTLAPAGLTYSKLGVLREPSGRPPPGEQAGT